jgi:hypothetical protein
MIAAGPLNRARHANRGATGIVSFMITVSVPAATTESTFR